MMYCPVCGSIDITGDHCQHCGSDVADDTGDEELQIEIKTGGKE